MKAVCLLSGGIDSPVAAYLVKNKGIDVVFLHGGNGKKSEKIEKLAKLVSLKSKVYYINHVNLLEQVVKKCERKYTCVICKRLLYKAAECLCKKIKAKLIITGESIGQVASQTLTNLQVLDAVVKTPIIRPLIGLNKNDIIIIAKQIKTYNISIKDAVACQFVPKHPATKAMLYKVAKEEENLELKIDDYFY